VFGFSSNPTGKVSPDYWTDFVFKKTAHVVEYGILTTLIYRAMINSGVSKIKAGYFSIIVAVLYAISDEFHQSFTPTREPTMRDILFDAIGSVSSVYVIWSLELSKRFKKVFARLNLLFELW
jgi:VanZ family protein